MGFVGSRFGRGSTVMLMDRIVLRSLEETVSFRVKSSDGHD
jgi:hypothetical protein